MEDLTDPKTALRHYLQESRDALLWKLDGLSEREARWPRTPTGTTLLGIVRHCANVEVGYFGPTFGRAWPSTDDELLVPEEAYDEDPQADWWVPAHIGTEQVVDFYRRVWSFADETLDALSLDARGRVPWWPEERAEVTLQRVLVHVHDDLARHAGHADVLRELADGGVGLRPGAGSNIPGGVDWPAYVARLRAVAEEFPAS